MSDTHDYETYDVLGKDLNHTMTLVGESGGLSAVYDVSKSSAMPGFMVVETEHGMLYLDPEHKFAVYDDQQEWVIVCIDDNDDRGRYWHNDDGWVLRDFADTFSNDERYSLNPPMGGKWEHA